MGRVWEHGQPRAWRPLSPVWGVPLSSCHRFLRHPEATPWPVRGRGEMRRTVPGSCEGGSGARGARVLPADGGLSTCQTRSERDEGLARTSDPWGALSNASSQSPSPLVCERTASARGPTATSPRPARWPRGPRPGLGEGQLARDNKQFFRWYELETNHIRI